MKITCIMSTSIILTSLCAIRQKIKMKKLLCRYCLQCFSSYRFLQRHKEICEQSGSIKVVPVSFKVYAVSNLF